ncbi:unnamed protein product [Rotaria sp. Silwood2]|nr:unnamed protein product [Rotaria sp. Silwood2]CAF2722195.1 unnamed protein product [Rotaria sp. Silwood2]CAF2870951.1 unnamed protein product [Rotaria sp. Silwood2]CAF4390242.1 unnamed protein product [Rotaria sp. Silwood2]CAF4667862.1 unnamed protein product [Rotaria sp. Silwood2]
MYTVIVIQLLLLDSICGISFFKTKKEVKTVLNTVIGIDLGTTYSCVGIYKNCHVEIIENDQGGRITPSFVGFTPNGERLVGDAAKNLLTSNPESTIFHMKRLIGRQFNDPMVAHDIKTFPFKVIEKNGKPLVQVYTGLDEKLFAPEEISAMVLSKMRQIAERYLGQNVTNAVVTVPAYFNDAQRQATKNAGIIAGLNILRIINEPTAAAIAYGLDNLNKKDGAKNILVYDLGGGTFDVSILTLDNGVFEVLATNGGEDFDTRVMDYFIKVFKKKSGYDIGKNIRSIEKLRREVEKAKRILSSEHETRIEIESFFQNQDFNEKLTRAKFEELNIDLFRSTMTPVRQVLKDAKLEVSDIAEVLLVGGSTRIPKVRQLIKDYFHGKEPSRSINPDEAVAYGAAIQAAILSGEECTSDIVILDVNPLTLGIETKGGVMSEIIPRNTPIPFIHMKPYSTTEDDQTSVDIKVFEGERSMTKDNHFLGHFVLSGIKSAPRGEPLIDVTFEIDVNGILNVTAKDRDTGNRNNIVINADKNQLSQRQIDRMVKDAQKYADEDQQMKDRIETRNNFEAYVYALRTQLKQPNTFLGRLSLTDKTTLENAIEKEIQWLESKPQASIDELKVEADQFEEIVTWITNKYDQQSSDFNSTRRQTYAHRTDL